MKGAVRAVVNCSSIIDLKAMAGKEGGIRLAYPIGYRGVGGECVVEEPKDE